MIILTKKDPIDLSKELFWDLPESIVTTIVDDNPGWVIPRVFEYGSIEEISKVIVFYGKETSQQVLIQMKQELKPMAKVMAHLYLDLELRDCDLQNIAKKELIEVAQKLCSTSQYMNVNRPLINTLLIETNIL